MKWSEVHAQFYERYTFHQQDLANEACRRAYADVLGKIREGCTLSAVALSDGDDYYFLLARRVAKTEWWLAEESETVLRTIHENNGVTYAQAVGPTILRQREILDLIGELPNEEHSYGVPSVLPPPGCFIFKWSGQWAAGGEEGPWKVQKWLVEAKSPEEALLAILHKLAFGPDDAFNGIYVAMPCEAGWRRLKPTKGDVLPLLRSDVMGGLSLATI